MKKYAFKIDTNKNVLLKLKTGKTVTIKVAS